VSARLVQPHRGVNLFGEEVVASQRYTLPLEDQAGSLPADAELRAQLAQGGTGLVRRDELLDPAVVKLLGATWLRLAAAWSARCGEVGKLPEQRLQCADLVFCVATSVA
jgi:hypothetical protein